MRSLEQVNIRTNVRMYVRMYVLTYIRTGQTLYPLHNFVVRGDNKRFANITVWIIGMNSFINVRDIQIHFLRSLIIIHLAFFVKMSVKDFLVAAITAYFCIRVKLASLKTTMQKCLVTVWLIYISSLVLHTRLKINGVGLLCTGALNHLGFSCYFFS